MERKNTMLLTVIAVATLLVAVVGATFAYYSVQNGANNSTTAINTTTGKAATVTYTAGTSQLYLNVTAAQMAQNLSGHTYYSTTGENTPAVDGTATPHTIGTFQVSGADTNDVHKCDFRFNVVTAGTLNDLDKHANGYITVITDANATWTGINSTYDFSNTGSASGSARNASVTITGEKTVTLTGYAQINNTAAIQNDKTVGNTNDISDLSDIETTIEITDVYCEAVTS